MILEQKLTRRLALALVLSGIFNIALLAFGLYEWNEGGFAYLATTPFKPKVAKLYRQQGKDLPTLTQVFRELEVLDFDGLCMTLRDPALVAEGYKKQDLALSLLASQHHFDVARALQGKVRERRLFTYMSQANVPAEVILYPGLTPEQFTDLVDFAKKEKWPYTSRGLLAKLKEQDETKQQDPLLKELFYQTNEFRTALALLCRGTQISKNDVLELVKVCDWKEVTHLYEQMAKTQDFSPAVRRAFLLKVMPHSAHMLYKADAQFSLHSLSDKQVLAMLQALKEHPESAKSYSLSLLEGPRSDAVMQKAVIVLSETLSLDSTKETRETLLQRFGKLPAKVAQTPPSQPKPKAHLMPNALPVATALKPISRVKPTYAGKPAPVKPKMKEILYVVQSGDTLWHLSKRFGVDIELIKKHNKLTTDALKPGTQLRIPQNPQKPHPKRF